MCTAAMEVILLTPSTLKAQIHQWFSGLGLRKLVVLPKNLKVNANVDLELLADHLPESFDMYSAKIFQQDGALAHTLPDL